MASGLESSSRGRDRVELLPAQIGRVARAGIEHRVSRTLRGRTAGRDAWKCLYKISSRLQGYGPPHVARAGAKLSSHRVAPEGVRTL